MNDFIVSHYFDWAATTFLVPSAADAMQFYIKNEQIQGNPSSPHIAGRQAAEILSKCREIFAEAFHVPPQQVIFTSGGTEANNLAIQGFAKSFNSVAEADRIPYFLVSPTAHHSMYESVLSFNTSPYRVQAIGVNSETGELDFYPVEEWAYYKGGIPAMIALEEVNNETGVMNPVETFVKKAKLLDNVSILVDAVQALPHCPERVLHLGADFISISSHKIGGPKGVGALIVRSPEKLKGIFLGGGQEANYRPGTQNVLGILGFTCAFQDLVNHKFLLFRDSKTQDRDNTVKTLIKHYHLNTTVSLDNCVPGFYNLYLPCESAFVAAALSEKGYCVSTGAACSGVEERSHVLEHMGKEGNRGLRIVTSCYNTTSAIVDLFQTLSEILQEITSNK